MKILFVDDDKTTLFLGKRIIESCENVKFVATAENGKEALNVLDEKHFDYVFTDINMPEMDGWELINNLSDYEGKIVCFIPEMDTKNRDKAKALNLLCLEKPITTEKVNEILNG